MVWRYLKTFLHVVIVQFKLAFLCKIRNHYFFRNLGNNIFPHLPTAGLERLLHLKTFNNPNLREFPPPSDFPRIQTLILSYAYHCCAFLPLIPSNPPPAKAKDIIVFPDIEDIDLNFWNSSVDLWPSQRKLLSETYILGYLIYQLIFVIKIVVNFREYKSEIW